MKIGFIGLGNMAGTICQVLIKSDFIDGSEVYGYDTVSYTHLLSDIGSSLNIWILSW